MEETMISGITTDSFIARIAIIGVKDEPGVAFNIFKTLADKNINIDIILQSIGRDNSKDIIFTVSKNDKYAAIEALNSNRELLGFNSFSVNDDLCKITLSGSGMLKNSGIASLMFEALSDANININEISTSEIKISVLIDAKNEESAKRSIHKKFFG